MSAWDDSGREVDAEFEFHLAEATDELVAAGVPPDVAREQALAKLGNIERWRTECLHLRRGRGIMLVKLQWAAIALLLGALGAICFRWQQERDSHALQLQAVLSDLAESRQALGGAQLTRSLAESISRSVKRHDGLPVQLGDLPLIHLQSHAFTEALTRQILLERTGKAGLPFQVSTSGDLRLPEASIRIDPASPPDSDEKR